MHTLEVREKIVRIRLRISMVMIVRLLVPLLLVLVGTARAESSPATRVDAVTVYRSGAQVTRVAEVALESGVNEVTLSDLPPDVDPRGLRVEVSAPGVRVGQVHVSRLERRDPNDPQVQRLTAELERVKLRLGELEDDTKSAELQLKFLDGMAEGYAKQAWLEGARGSADVASWQQALTVLGDGADTARRRIRTNGVARAEAEKDRQRLERELATLQRGTLASSRVHVAVESERAQTAELALVYFRHAAGWEPWYEARLATGTGRLELIQNAMVRQSTAEPWRDVRLTLSTSEPALDFTPPKLASLFLDLRKPGTVAKSVEHFRIAPIEEVVVAADSGVTAQVAPYAVTYTVPGRVTIPNETDDARSFEVARYGYDARLVTKLMPRLSTDAYLTVVVRHDDRAPLYAAPMGVYVDGNYVGQTEMPTLLPGAEATLPMGPDRRVQLVVRDQGGEKTESGIIGRRRVEPTDYLFEITNRHEREVAVEVHDRYPVARNDEIEVEVPRSATPPDARDLDDRPGVVVWRKRLAAGESWRIRHQYQVSYPANMALVSE